MQYNTKDRLAIMSESLPFLLPKIFFSYQQPHLPSQRTINGVTESQDIKSTNTRARYQLKYLGVRLDQPEPESVCIWS
jgi:hypothetical protein